MDVLEQSLYDLGIGWNEYYDRSIQSGLTARSYTYQKDRTQYYARFQAGKELRDGGVE